VARSEGVTATSGDSFNGLVGKTTGDTFI
jgi:hypothetical protein